MVKKSKKIQYSWGQFFKDYWSLLEGRRAKFTFYTAATSVSHLIPFIIAFLLGMMIDFFINYGGGSLNTFYYLILGIGILGVFQVWLRFYGKEGLQMIGGTIRKEIRIASMSKIMDLELKWHDKEETGSKLQKISRGTDKVYRGISSFSNDGISILVGLIGSLIIFLFLDLKYLAFGLIYIIIYLSGEYYFSQKVNYWQDKLNKIREKVSGKLHESASNLLTVKSLGLKEVFKQSTTSFEEKYFKIWDETRRISRLKFKTIKIFSAIGYASFILLVGLDAVTGAITAGSILVFIAYFDRLMNAAHKITNKSFDFIEVKSGVGRFMTIFGIEIIDRDKNAIEIPKNWKTIEFKDVTFKYKNKNVLENFNLKVNRNEKIGVVGKSGCGKSTLAKILLGLYKIQKGKILIDGKCLEKYKHTSITNTIGIVLQESEIFNTSLLKNVTISSIKKDFKTFDMSIKISQLEGLIKRLPKGINTPLGEKGYHLSGGERQRVGIARAVYKDCSFLILDEATSSLDSKTESKIQEGINAELGNKTLLIIAHRLSTLKNVDKIIVMEKGKIIEKGTYKELLQEKGRFFSLCKQQKMRK